MWVNLNKKLSFVVFSETTFFVKDFVELYTNNPSEKKWIWNQISNLITFLFLCSAFTSADDKRRVIELWFEFLLSQSGVSKIQLDKRVCCWKRGNLRLFKVSFRAYLIRKEKLEIFNRFLDRKLENLSLLLPFFILFASTKVASSSFFHDKTVLNLKNSFFNLSQSFMFDLNSLKFHKVGVDLLKPSVYLRSLWIVFNDCFSRFNCKTLLSFMFED